MYNTRFIKLLLEVKRRPVPCWSTTVRYLRVYPTEAIYDKDRSVEAVGTSPKRAYRWRHCRRHWLSQESCCRWPWSRRVGFGRSRDSPATFNVEINLISLLTIMLDINASVLQQRNTMTNATRTAVVCLSLESDAFLAIKTICCSFAWSIECPLHSTGTIKKSCKK